MESTKLSYESLASNQENFSTNKFDEIVGSQRLPEQLRVKVEALWYKRRFRSRQSSQLWLDTEFSAIYWQTQEKTFMAYISDVAEVLTSESRYWQKKGILSNAVEIVTNRYKLRFLFYDQKSWSSIYRGLIYCMSKFKNTKEGWELTVLESAWNSISWEGLAACSSVCNFVKDLGIRCRKEYLEQIIKIVNPDNSGSFTKSEFQKFVDSLLIHPLAADIMDQNFDFEAFLLSVQCDIHLESINEFMFSLGHPFLIDSRVSVYGLSRYLFDNINIICDAKKRPYMAMDRPLSHYLIKTCLEVQELGKVKCPKDVVKRYIKAILQGYKCVDLRVSSSPSECPMISSSIEKNGVSVPLSAVVKTLHDYSFLKSPTPMFLMLRWGPLELSERVHSIMRNILGDDLYLYPGEGAPLSPEALKYKFLVVCYLWDRSGREDYYDGVVSFSFGQKGRQDMLPYRIPRHLSQVIPAVHSNTSFVAINAFGIDNVVSLYEGLFQFSDCGYILKPEQLEKEKLAEVSIQLCAGKNLPLNLAFMQKQRTNHYIKFTHMTVSGQTTAYESSVTFGNVLNPIWNEKQFNFQMRHVYDMLLVELWHSDPVKSCILRTRTCPIYQLRQGYRYIELDKDNSGILVHVTIKKATQSGF